MKVKKGDLLRHDDTMIPGTERTLMLDVREPPLEKLQSTFELEQETEALRERISGAGKPLYSSKIIKAGALLADTKTLLAHWDVNASVRNNMDRMRQENIFGKASESCFYDTRSTC